MCDYMGYEFGAGSYPDSVCIDGSLHDADRCDKDGNIYLLSDDVPCPACRQQDAVTWWAERNAMFWNHDEDMSDEDAHNHRALDSATRLVNDIRVNRGLAVTKPQQI